MPGPTGLDNGLFMFLGLVLFWPLGIRVNLFGGFMPPNLCQTFTQEKLARMKAAFFARVGYVPSDGQSLVHFSNKRYRIVLAGARYGKSMLCGSEGAFFLLFPDFRIWCVAPVYELAEKEFNWCLEFLSRFRLKDGRNILDLGKLSNPSRGSRSLVLPWGAFIKTKSTEIPQALLGEELDMLILGEAACLPREPWERMLRARIGPRNGQVLAASTGAGDGGLFAEFVSNGQSDDPDFSPYWKTWQFKTIENPYFSQEEYAQAKQELDPDVFAEQYEGRLISRRGFVFRFSEQHICKQLPSGIENMPVLVSIQPGFKNPCVVVFFTYDIEKRTYLVFDEIYVKEVLVQDIVAEIRKKTAGRRFLGCLTDYWVKDAIDDFTKSGLAVITNEEEKKVGRIQATVLRVRALQNILKIREDGEPRLKIYIKCENTIADFQKCKWPDKPKEESDKLEAEIPLPKYFQAPQAVSHAVSFIEMSNNVNIYSVQK